MHYLLDTHIFLWWLNATNKLAQPLQMVIQDPNNYIYISTATAWEISIKHRTGKLPLKTTISEMISISGFQVLPITLPHILQLEKLPVHHNDPFDRILIAQAKEENLILITDDSKIKQYDVKVFL
ncbi:MAG TPA: type II toxin-antitoxin system VapC family toxin [Candidatus Saccharimonadales bacterium]|nr:type II toxin-antitoxin system VapC family toxin [Candidatus Saccharimonadales bacterium]